ncbi:uncharacterized protein C2845_PM17G01260 [Panicum miliaceum]|uniref:RING-type domain-containing protein n=1 Tax=Panicum miliaceum TaxID=4540 RepID=A0A3L6Q476_PANMI|nr:uncharacterized protein C2845_PM17G01260 [Panicum miliaceum]
MVAVPFQARSSAIDPTLHHLFFRTSSVYQQLFIARAIPAHAKMRAYLRASAIATAPALAPAPAAVSTAAAAGGVGLGYGIAIAVGALVLVSTVMLISYLCVLTKAGAAHAARLLAAADTAAPPSAAAVPGLDIAAIDALYPKYPHAAGPSYDGGGPCAICLGEFARGDALRRGPGCRHRFHACCAERWLRVSATCPVCRDSPVATPLAEAVPLAAHARRRHMHVYFDDPSRDLAVSDSRTDSDLQSVGFPSHQSDAEADSALTCGRAGIQSTTPFTYKYSSPPFLHRSHPSLPPSRLPIDMASLGPEIFSRGFRLNPTPLEAATYYLPQLLAGALLHESIRPFIHHADVYACEPGELARQFRPLPRTGHRFFFTHCKLQRPQRAGKASKVTRAAGPGSWHSQGVTDVVDSEEVKVGEMRKLRYRKGGAYTDWLMDEYSCRLHDAVVGDRQYVFCNIYVSPRAAPGSAARQESAAFFAPPAPVVIAQAAPPKRPAPQVAEPPCPRMRGVAPTPPVVQPAAGCAAYFAPPRPCVPNRAVAPPSTPSAIRSSPAPAPTRLAAPRSRTPAPAPPRPFGQPKQQICLGGVAPPSTHSVMSPASSQPPVPAPARLAAPPCRTAAPAPPRPLGQPKQQMPPPTPPVVRAFHMPVQAPAHHCRPQPSAQTKKRTREPFEAAEQLRDEAEESPAALQDDDFDEDDLAKAMEEAVATAEAEEEAAANSTMTDDEMERHLCSLLGNETVIVPKEEIPDAIA